MSKIAHLESSWTASEPIGITSSWPVRTISMWTISSPSVPPSKYSIATASPISSWSASRKAASMTWVAAPGALSTDILSSRSAAAAGSVAARPARGTSERERGELASGEHCFASLIGCP